MCDYLYRSKIEGFSNPSFSSVVLVISPLKALMGDQLKEILKYGLSGKKLHGGRAGRCWRRKIQNFDFVAREFKGKKNTGSATTITPKNCVCGH